MNLIDPSGYQSPAGAVVPGGGVALACAATAPACAAAIAYGAPVIGTIAVGIIIYVSVDYLIQHPELGAVSYPGGPIPAPPPAPPRPIPGGTPVPPLIGPPPTPPFVSADGSKPISAVPGRDPGGTPEPEPAPTPIDWFPPTSTCTPEPRKLHISFGLTFHPSDQSRANDILALFTRNLRTVYEPQGIDVFEFREWQQNGVIDNLRIDPYGPAFQRATQKAEEIHFNLEGISEIDNIDPFDPYNDFAENFGSKGDFYLTMLGKALNSQGPGLPPPFVTADELYIIKNRADLCAKSSFYKHGSTSLVESMKSWAEICTR